jgi:hypothetical protein
VLKITPTGARDGFQCDIKLCPERATVLIHDDDACVGLFSCEEHREAMMVIVEYRVKQSHRISELLEADTDSQ